MLSQARLKEMLRYDPETGRFTWLVAKSRCIKAGIVAGFYNDGGYRVIAVENRSYKAHRLAWLYQTGMWPDNEIDHIDGNPSNNSWANLREATHAQNCSNRGTRRDNPLGVKGVDKLRNKYRARVYVAGVSKHLGCFDTVDEARRAYAAAALEAFGEFVRPETHACFKAVTGTAEAPLDAQEREA